MSNDLPPPLADFAARLLRHEVGTSDGGTVELPAAFERVCRALHVRLSPVISAAGFQALFNRAIKVAARDFPFLVTMTVGGDRDCISGMPAADGRGPDALAEGLTAVLAHFIWLLVIFIGENLGLRMVRDIWPEVPLGRLHGDSGAAE